MIRNFLNNCMEVISGAVFFLVRDKSKEAYSPFAFNKAKLSLKLLTGHCLNGVCAINISITICGSYLEEHETE